MSGNSRHRLQAFACFFAVLGLCMYWRHESMPEEQTIVLVSEEAGPRWAIATLITLSARSACQSCM